jgi:hypothetical protein
MKIRSPFLRWVRILCAFLALVFGLLALASGVLGPNPIKLWSSGESYYQIVVEPSPYWALMAATGISLALVLFGLPTLLNGGRR